MRSTLGSARWLGLLAVLLTGTAWADTMDQYPISETPVYGTVTGSYTSLMASDNVYEAIKEVMNGTSYSWCEWKWTFNVRSGTAQQFRIEAYRPSNSDSDNFQFAYSTDGTNYTNMVSITKTTDNNTDQTYSLPAATSGTVYVRVRDTNRSNGKNSLDTVYIDRMRIVRTYTDASLPAAVSNLSCSNITAGSIQLNWTAPSDADSPCTAYDIRYSASAITAANFSSATQVTGAPTPASPGNNQNMTVSGLSGNTTYYFAMKTADSHPNWSAISNVPSAKTLDTTPPAAITNLATSSPTGNSITLTWTAPSDPDSACTAYDIRYSTSAITAGNFSSATQVTGAPAPASGGTNQNMVVSGLSSNTTYYFAMKTSDAVPNWSAISNVPSGTTLDNTAPAAVTNLATSSPTSSSITLTWTAPSDPDSSCTAYDIRYSTGTITAGNFSSATQVTGAPAPASPGTNQNVTVSGLNPSTTYYFAMKTSDAVPNWSAISNVPAGTTSAAAPVVVALKRDAGLTTAGAIDARFNSATVRTVTVTDAGIYNVGNSRWMNSGACARPSIAAYMLYKFDLSSIPANSTINLAQLRLYHTGGNNAMGRGDVYMVLTHDWTEGTGAIDMASYPGAAGGVSFAHPNGKNTDCYQDADGGTSGSLQTWGTASNAFFDITVDAGSPLIPSSMPIGTGYHVIPVTAHVQQWVSGTTPNYGWAQPRGYWDFHCSEAGTDLEPVLFIDYTPGGGADVTPPAAVTNLSCSNITASSIQLNWTAPSDPDSACTAYDIRYSTSAITAANFSSATQVSGAPAPASPGNNQNMVVSGLSSNTTYYFAMKTSDAVLNWSTISNVPSATTLDNTPPAAITNLATSSPTASSITLTWTAPSDPDSACTAYDIRYSTSTITAGNFSSATQVSGAPAPASGGTNQNLVVNSLSAGTTYYFAIETADAVPNWSSLSNIASGTTSNVAQGPITVQHVGLNISGWRGGTEISATYCFIDNWPNANADGTFAQFSKTDLQSAIDTIQAAYKGWDAKVYVTQASWITDPIPSNLSPVVASVDIDTDTLVWGSSNAYSAGSGGWKYNGTTYASFVDAVNAGVAAGASAVADTPAWTSLWDTSLPAACWDIIVDVPESLVNTYLDNPSSDGLFVGAKKTDGSVSIFTGDQWDHQANIRVVVQQPPQTGPWIGVNPYVIAKTIALNNPTTTQTVTVTNGGTGTFTWTATANPTVSWMSITGGSGSPNGQFTLNFNVTGLAVGTYTTKVRVTAAGAANTPLDIPVRVQVTPIPDTTPPADITNLAASNPTDTTVTLSWTAPGDDGNVGTATTYDIRYSTSTINDANWASATQVNGEIPPAAAGTPQSMIITGLNPTTTYYFAMKTADEVPNWSGLSNVVSATTTVAMQGPVTVKHIGGNTSGWRGGYNISPTYCWVSNWPNSNADAEIGEFDRTELQSAITTIYNAYSGWDAKMVLSQVNWNSTQPPSGLTMVAGSADLDRSTVVWQNGNAFGAGNGNWSFNGTGYSDFATAVNAGTSSGRTVVTSGMPYTSVWDTGLPAACWDIVMDIPESLINAYMQSPTALGLFASCTDATGLVVHANDQWSHQANIRIVIQRPPQTAPWIGLNTLAVNRIIALTGPTDSQTINVTNAGTGTLSWTATANPSVGWMTITNGSGTNSGSFTANFNVTGLTAGNTYTTKIRLAAIGAANTPQDINVSVKVVANASPIIQLAPTSLSYDMAPTDAPAGQNVTVTNAGLGTLNWTAAVQGSASWLTLSNASGTSGQAFTATVNPSGLSMGTYSANIQVSATGASNSPQAVPVSLMVRQKDANITTANSYDDTWETGPSGWVQHCTNIMNAWSGKTDGFVVHVGDSITYAAPYSSWARYGQGKTTTDTNICAWMHASVDGDGTNNTNSGWWLARYDVPNRAGSFTARSGIRADQYLAGLTYPDLPGVDQMFTSGFTNPDGKQYRDAEICILMLGTNDVGANRTSAAFIADLGAIVDKMLAANVIVAVSTLPPRYGCDTAINDYNTQIRSMAQTKAIPLIDFYQEVVRRRPNGTWMNTLISSDGVHPSADYGGSHADSDPYANNGDALSNSGYLLRDWLSVQKIQEIKSKVITGATTWNVSTTADLQSAVDNYAPGDTIVIAPGTYTPGRRFMMDNGACTVRGSTGNRDDVIIQGPGMAVNTEPTEMFDLYSSDVTIKDLTIKEVYYHGVHIRAELNVDRTHLQNIHTINCGERHFKGSFDSGNPSSVSDDVLIENCLCEQTQPNTNHTDNDYIAGIDVMGVNNLIIRDNVFKNIVGPTGGGRAAIFIWHHNTNCTIERNQIYGCDRGISICNPGWAGPGAGSSGGIIRNNMITRGVNIALELCFTDSMKVYYNTIYSDDASYYRTVSIYDSASIFVTNNLQFKYNIIRGLISNTSAGTGNVTEVGDITGSTPATNWFVNPAIGDLHLTASATGALNAGVLLTDVPTDFDKQNRSSTPDIGADESSY